MQRIENYIDFLNEAYKNPMDPEGKYKRPDEVETKLDNSGFKRMETWLSKNIDLLAPLDSGDPYLDKQRYKIDPKTKKKIKYKSQGQYNRERWLEMKKLEEKGLDTGYPFGYCYPVMQFVWYSLDGYDGMYWLRCMNELEFEYKGIKSKTSHWYCQHKTSGRIIDLTRSQFDQIPNFSIDDLYQKRGRVQNLGRSYYTLKSGKKVEFGHTVPCYQTLKLYDRYREDVGILPGLEKYWKACNYASERRSKSEEEKLKEIRKSKKS